MRYEDLTHDDLGTKRQRPMFLSDFIEFRAGMNMRTYPHDPSKFCNETFLPAIDEWIQSREPACGASGWAM